MQLTIEDLCFSYTDESVIHEVSLQVQKGEFVGLLGPNGSGKSTILKNVYRALTPQKGLITFDGTNLFQMSYRDSAKKIGVAGQEHEIPFDFTVEDIVAMGRTPHKKLFQMDNQHDRQIIYHALEHVGMEKMCSQNYQNLSGGEKQRVVLARVIAQETDVFILDEPTNHLDINYQIELFEFMKRLNMTTLATMHDLNMAALYCDKIYLLKNGSICYSGTPEQILKAEIIRDVFGVDADVIIHPITKRPTITFIPNLKGIIS